MSIEFLPRQGFISCGFSVALAQPLNENQNYPNTLWNSQIHIFFLLITVKYMKKNEHWLWETSKCTVEVGACTAWHLWHHSVLIDTFQLALEDIWLYYWIIVVSMRIEAQEHTVDCLLSLSNDKREFNAVMHSLINWFTPDSRI